MKPDYVVVKHGYEVETKVYYAYGLDDAIEVANGLPFTEAADGFEPCDWRIYKRVFTQRKPSLFSRFLKWLDDKASCGY